MEPDSPRDECWCSKDDDGRCIVCSERLSALIFQVGDNMLRIPKMAQSLCQPCRKANADWAAAKALRELLAAHPDLGISAVTAFVNNFVSTSGITKNPLLDTEIKRVAGMKKNPDTEST